MQKIASPQELQAEIRRILSYCQGPDRPSRELLAAELQNLADRVAGIRWRKTPEEFDVLLTKYEKLRQPPEAFVDITNDLTDNLRNLKSKKLVDARAHKAFDKRIQAIYDKWMAVVKDQR